MATITPIVTNLPPPPVRQPIQGKDGVMSSDWVRWFQLIWNRTGASTGSTIYDPVPAEPTLQGTELQYLVTTEQEQVTRLVEPPFVVPPEFPPEDLNIGGIIQAVLGSTSSDSTCCTFDYVAAGETLTLAPRQQHLTLNIMEVAGSIDNNGGTLGVLL